MDLNRLKDFKIYLLYEDGTDVGGVISNYKPPKPAQLRKGIDTIAGYTYFQEDHKSDCKIKFTISFQIKGKNDAETLENIKKYTKFKSKYSERFTLVDEFGTLYKGYFQNDYDIDTPIEGDIYYISLEMQCNHEVTGWVADNGDM